MAIFPEAALHGPARFFRWWGGELLGCIPARIREAFGRGRNQLVVEILDTGAIFFHAKGANLRKLGEVALSPAELEGRPEPGRRDSIGRIVSGANLRSAEVALRLPRDKALRRLVELPAEAAENMREVLGFEMDRHTPFSVEEVYYDFRVQGIDPGGEKIKVDLVVARRATVDRVLRLAAEWGLEYDSLEVADGSNGGGPSFDLLPRGGARRRGTVRRRVSISLGVLAVVLLSTLVYLPLQEKKQHYSRLAAELADVRAQAARVDELKERVEELVARNGFVLGRKRQERTVTEVLDEVTRLLPDHTWVLKFGVNKGRLTISGFSAKPSALIGLLETSKTFSGVRFSSPVTLDQKRGLERFNLSAAITGRAQP